MSYLKDKLKYHVTGAIERGESQAVISIPLDLKITKTAMMDIRVRCIGVMKRDRKVKLHNLDIEVDLPYEDIDLAEYVGRAKIFVKSRMKTLEKCEIYLSPWTRIDEEGYAHSMKEVTFGDKRYRKLDIGSNWL